MFKLEGEDKIEELSPKDKQRIKKIEDRILPIVIANKLINCDIRFEYYRSENSYTEHSKYKKNENDVVLIGLYINGNSNTIECIINRQNGDIAFIANGYDKQSNYINTNLEIKDFLYLKNIYALDNEDYIVNFAINTIEIYFLNSKNDELVIELIRKYLDIMF